MTSPFYIGVNMSNEYGKFKFKIGQLITSFGRNLEIIDTKYVDEIAKKKDRSYNVHRKYYKYKCLNCGNEDWVIEYCLEDYRHCGCNVCCTPPKKIVSGINDIATTAPWMVKYIVDEEDTHRYAKTYKGKIKMKCPDCGRIHMKAPNNVYANKGLTCVCGDGWSYPNKFMYALLSYLNFEFEAEMIFDWSDGRIYDDYLVLDGEDIIIENHGNQHYDKPIIKSKIYRSLEDEIKNDIFKRELALDNGIEHYFEIDCRKSDAEYIRNSIIQSGLLNLLKVEPVDVDWDYCDEFALSNLSKKIALYKRDNPKVTLRQIAKIFNVNYNAVLRSVKAGNKFGWCDYKIGDDLLMLREDHKLPTRAKPIHCISIGHYYRSSDEFVSCYEEEFGKKLCARNIRSVCEGKRHYVNNLRFEYITQEQFNKIKSESPEIAHGDYFVIRSAAA